MTSSALLPFRSSLSRGLSRPPAHDSLTQQPLRPGLLRRILEAVAQANQRRAERVIAAYVARNGGRLTDSLERGIERSFLSLLAGGSPLLHFSEFLLWRPTMILITAMRLVHQVWVEARALQRETLKRYPHLRDS